LSKLVEYLPENLTTSALSKIRVIVSAFFVSLKTILVPSVVNLTEFDRALVYSESKSVIQALRVPIIGLNWTLPVESA
jgi:hypothetical protein